MKKKVIILIIVVLVIPVLYSFLTNKVNRCEDVFNVSLPSNIKEIYSIGPKDNWMGEGTFYEVYQLNEKSDFGTTDYKTDKNLALETKIKELTLPLKIEDKYYPQFNSQYLYKIVNENNNELILLYNSDSLQLIAISDIK